MKRLVVWVRSEATVAGIVIAAAGLSVGALFGLAFSMRLDERADRAHRRELEACTTIREPVLRALCIRPSVMEHLEP